MRFRPDAYWQLGLSCARLLLQRFVTRDLWKDARQDLGSPRADVQYQLAGVGVLLVCVVSCPGKRRLSPKRQADTYAKTLGRDGGDLKNGIVSNYAENVFFPPMETRR